MATSTDGLPFAQFEWVSVTFPATADVDVDIPYTGLTPPTPNDVDFWVTGWQFASAPASAPVVYVNTGVTRREWVRGRITVRANVANATCQVLLTVRR